MNIVWVNIGEIKPNPKNRNLHSEEQIERLSKIIRYQGFRQPVIISKRSGLLVAGHGRLLAAKALGMESVPAIHQEFDSDDQEYAAGISDNSIALWSDLDLFSINEDLSLLDGQNFDLDLLGIEDFSLEPKTWNKKPCPQCGYDYKK